MASGNTLPHSLATPIPATSHSAQGHTAPRARTPDPATLFADNPVYATFAAAAAMPTPRPTPDSSDLQLSSLNQYLAPSNHSTYSPFLASPHPDPYITSLLYGSKSPSAASAPPPSQLASNNELRRAEIYKRAALYSTQSQEKRVSQHIKYDFPKGQLNRSLTAAQKEKERKARSLRQLNNEAPLALSPSGSDPNGVSNVKMRLHIQPRKIVNGRDSPAFVSRFFL